MSAPVTTDGAELLDRIEAFLSRFVAYPNNETRIAHVLWIAHTHIMDAWDSTPRIAFLSPEPGSGKSRALEVTELLVPRPVLAVNTTPAYLFRKVAEKAGKPTILYDEIDTVFGPRAKDANEDIRGMLNAGHRKGAMAGRCVVRGKIIETEELEAYAAVALAGLDDLPDTLMSRSVVVRMRRRRADELIEPFRLREQSVEGGNLCSELAEWTDRAVVVGRWPHLPDEITDRAADCWEALIAIADAAGGDWPKLARVSAVTLVTASMSGPPSLGIRLLTDLRDIFGDDDHLFTEDILRRLHDLPEAPWGDLRGSPLDARGLAFRLGKYEIHPMTVRVGTHTSKGYRRVDLIDAWARYVTAREDELTRSSRRKEQVEGTDTLLDGPDIEAVTTVTPSQQGEIVVGRPTLELVAS